jgi:hypothetical protein
MRTVPTLVVLLLLCARSAFAWQENGILVCNVPGNQDSPRITSDGSGGTYIAWVDYRNGTSNRDVFLQRITGAGEIAPGWSPGGLAVCTAPEHQHVTSLIGDGSGGLYLVWDDHRNSTSTFLDIHAHHVLGSGTVNPAWPDNGRAIATLPGAQFAGRLALDGQGGLFITWSDASAGGFNFRDIYLQRLNRDGTLASGWPEGGKVIATGPWVRFSPRILPDGGGGAFVAWTDLRDEPTSLTTGDIYALRVTADGDPAPGWTPHGTVVCAEMNTQAVRGVAPDGSGGFYVAWQDWRSAPPDDPEGNVYGDVYLQRMTASGAPADGWPVSGLPVCTARELQQEIDIVADGLGAALLVWSDYRDNQADVYAQRILPDATIASGWPVNGRLVSTAPGYQTDTRIAPDGQGGAYVSFTSLTDRYRVQAQHLTTTGEVMPGWPTDGVYLAMLDSDQQRPTIAADGLGRAVVTWYDSRPGPTIYAQQVGPNGPTPVQIALVGAETEPGLVRLTWFAADVSQLDATVERRTMSSEWDALGKADLSGDGTLRFEDRSVTPGGRYAYRLRYQDGDELAYTAEAWVEVPALRFALHGFTPNPAVDRRPTISFSLAHGEGATLELFGVDGRRVFAREVGSLGAGAHRLEMDARLPAGVYSLRLTQGEQRAMARAVILR